MVRSQFGEVKEPARPNTDPRPGGAGAGAARGIVREQQPPIPDQPAVKMGYDGESAGAGAPDPAQSAAARADQGDQSDQDD